MSSTSPPPPHPSIPPSPPGTPAHDTSTKFTHFRQLKSQGIHFNEQLTQSSTLANPSLAERLMAFVGVAGADEYTSCLPTDVWDPAKLAQEPVDKEVLAKAQAEVNKKRERERGGKVEFVAPGGDTEGSGGERRMKRVRVQAGESLKKGVENGGGGGYKS